MDHPLPELAQTELAGLRQQLRSLYKQKEQSFRRKKQAQEKISSLLERVKLLKTERDALTKEVKQFKQQREAVNHQRKEQVHQQASQGSFRALQSSERPEAIQRQMNRMEERLETEVMSFSREQALRKAIKELKQKHIEARQRFEQWRTVVQQSQLLAGLSVQADAFHHHIQEKARESQCKHEELLSILPQLTVLREEKKKYDQEYAQLRGQYLQLQAQVKERAQQIQRDAELLKEDEQQHVNALLMQKSVQLQEKMQKRKKLTTDDVLVFQALEGK